jgi:hypothetical protein
MGVSGARWLWIALLDDDDLWSPDKLKHQLAAAASGRSWVYAGAVEIDSHGVLVGGEPPPSPEQLARTLRRQNAMPAGSSNVLVRTELFRYVGGFDQRLTHLADWSLWLRLLPHGLPACAALPLVAYRQHAGQATLDPSGMIAEARILRKEHGTDLNSIRRWLAWSHLRRGERLLATRAYVRAAIGGNLSSLPRAAVAMFHPRPVAVRHRDVGAHNSWAQAAEGWLRASAD